MKILKFGGSSVGSPRIIECVIEITTMGITETTMTRGVVVSAFQGVTNELIRLCKTASSGEPTWHDDLLVLKERHLEAARCLITHGDASRVHGQIEQWCDNLKDVLQGVSLVKEFSPRTLDFIMSFGERLSAFIIAEAMKDRGVSAEYLDARELIKTDDSFGYAKVDIETSYQLIQRHFASRPALQVITGFIGSTQKEETTTLGRGGSDYTASLFGAALQASVIEIWTDVDGVLTADPRKVGKAFPVDQMTYEEAMELSHFGAKVIYPPTMQPALARGIPILIKNTFNPSARGTLISTARSEKGYPVTGISSISDVALITVQGSGMVGVAGTAMRLFRALATAKVNIVLITQASSEHTICLAIDPTDAEAARRVIRDEFALELHTGLIDPPLIEDNLSIISIVGEGMRHTRGISGKCFGALGKNGVNVVAIAQGSSERNISAVIAKRDEKKALNALHDEFFLSDVRTLNLFIAGTGLIGKTLLAQIQNQREALLKDHSIELKLLGLINSRRMMLNSDGIPLEQCLNRLDEEGQHSNLDLFLRELKEFNLPNCVFVDCTATEEIPLRYTEILGSHISIVTPNKKGQAGRYSHYTAIRQASSRPGARFLYETSVGAGLPVISTLSDLLKSGDRILKIEAVLSGTLSFIFNSWREGHSFSDIVKSAQEKGYTEPDPRDDLNGVDVARKLLILGRECGLSLEMGDVSVEDLVPPSCKTADSVASFFAELRRHDEALEEKRKSAASRGNKLCYIATIEGDEARTALEEVGPDHPFFSLSGSDNIISFTTERYRERPLVVKGPGAGAEVTAAGVFADIVRLSYFGR